MNKSEHSVKYPKHPLIARIPDRDISGSASRIIVSLAVLLACSVSGGCSKSTHQEGPPSKARVDAPPRYPSQPFKGYSQDDEVHLAGRREADFGILNEDEAAFKTLVTDAHYLYAAFVRYFPKSKHAPELTRQLSRFDIYQVTGGADDISIPVGDLIKEFHWNRDTYGGIWMDSAFTRVNGVPVGAPTHWGNIQFRGTAVRKGDFVSLTQGTSIIFPKREMSAETMKYRHETGISAGYFPNAGSPVSREDLLEQADNEYQKGNDRGKVEAIKLWTRAAEMGSPRGQFNLAAAIINGEWLSNDRAEGAKWLYLANEGEDVLAKKALVDVRPRITDADWTEGVKRASEWTAKASASVHGSSVHPPSTKQLPPTSGVLHE